MILEEILNSNNKDTVFVKHGNWIKTRKLIYSHATRFCSNLILNIVTKTSISSNMLNIRAFIGDRPSVMLGSRSVKFIRIISNKGVSFGLTRVPSTLPLLSVSKFQKNEEKIPKSLFLNHCS